MAMRLVLFPVFVKQIRSQRAMQALQPKMKELQAKYKNDKEKLNQEMMALWKETRRQPAVRLPAAAAADPDLHLAVPHAARDQADAASSVRLATCVELLPE